MPNHPRILAPAVTLAAALAATTASAQESVLLDHFDDGLLDPAWQVSFQNADDWSLLESGSELTVNDISHVGTNEWARVRLTRAVTPLDDFHMRAEISWTTGDFDDAAMQGLIVNLLDADGDLVALAFYSDAWVGWSGTIGGGIEDGSSWNGGENYSAYDGNGVLEIERTGTDVTVRVAAGDGGNTIEGLSGTPVEQVQIEFQFYPFTGGGPSVLSFFGSVSIDLIQITRPSACVADLAEPFGTLDFSDVVAFLTAFGAGTPEADLADPIGVFDFSDVVAFLSAFGAGCP